MADGKQAVLDDRAAAHVEALTLLRRLGPEQLDALTAEFERDGAATRRFIGALPAEALQRRWTHPVHGEVTIESLLWIAPRHLRERVAQHDAATTG